MISSTVPIDTFGGPMLLCLDNLMTRRPLKTHSEKKKRIKPKIPQ
jgi:hypothetical protein